MGCPEAAMPIPAVVLVIGVLIVSAIIIRRDRLGIKDAILVMIGMKEYERGPLINWLTLVVVLAPVGLWLLLYERCQAAQTVALGL
ncbi:MAG: hypothetical protein AAGO57_02215 [Pseudomonadota bacterium]